MSDDKPPAMRSGRGPMVVQMLGQSFESAVTSLIGEVYKLAIKHAQLSGRSHIHPKDIQNAFKVVLLPSYEFRNSFDQVTHVQNAGALRRGLNGQTLTSHSMVMAGRLMAKASVDNELGNSDSVMEQCRQVQKEENQRLEEERRRQGQAASLFPEPQKLTGAQIGSAISSIAHLLQASEMPETTDEEFCFCSDKVQEQHNDMFLMERAEGLWAEYLEETDLGEKQPFERSLIAAVQEIDQQYAYAEEWAKQQWQKMLEAEEADGESEGEDKEKGDDR